jgi:hypothetical protein
VPCPSPARRAAARAPSPPRPAAMANAACRVARSCRVSTLSHDGVTIKHRESKSAAPRASSRSARALCSGATPKRPGCMKPSWQVHSTTRGGRVPSHAPVARERGRRRPRRPFSWPPVRTKRCAERPIRIDRSARQRAGPRWEARAAASSEAANAKCAWRGAAAGGGACCCMLHVACCCMLHVACCMLHDACCTLHAVCCMPHAAAVMLRACRSFCRRMRSSSCCFSSSFCALASCIPIPALAAASCLRSTLALGAPCRIDSARGWPLLGGMR